MSHDVCYEKKKNTAGKRIGTRVGNTILNTVIKVGSL